MKLEKIVRAESRSMIFLSSEREVRTACPLFLHCFHSREQSLTSFLTIAGSVKRDTRKNINMSARKQIVKE